MLPTTRTYPRRRTDRWPETGTEIDRFFEGLIGRPLAWTGRGSADLYETDDEYVLDIELPGFEQDEVEVTMEHGVLSISGARREESEEEGRLYHVRERLDDRFTRTFSLPQSVNADDVKADLANGVLTVHLPKAIEAKPRHIRIGAGKAGKAAK
ncbi:MAG: Hsp20/alpha crystallin family protein [Gemmatimonadota bacterium]